MLKPSGSDVLVYTRYCTQRANQAAAYPPYGRTKELVPVSTTSKTRDRCAEKQSRSEGDQVQ